MSESDIENLISHVIQHGGNINGIKFKYSEGKVSRLSLLSFLKLLLVRRAVEFTLQIELRLDKN